MENRSKAYYRHQRQRVMQHKLNICRFHYGLNSDWFFENPRYIGQLDKGKVHCSCGMCVEKTKTHGYKISQKAKLDLMKAELKQFQSFGME